MTTTAGVQIDELERYLAEKVPASPILQDIRLLDGGRSNITYELTTSTGPLILRRPPLGDIAQSANDVGREYRVMAALQGSVVPVPQTVAICTDPDVIGAPFTLVRKIDGRVLRGPADLAGMDAAEIDRCFGSLIDTLALLHSVEPGAVGLEKLGRPEGFVARQVERWKRQLDAVATKDQPAAYELYRRLAKAVPGSVRSGIVHGDYRLDNVMVGADDAGDLVAVLDWEMATLGDPLTDLGLMMVYHDPLAAPILPLGHPTAGNPDVPTSQELARRYAEASGADLSDLDFYEALGSFKLAVIAEGIHGRYLSGLTVGDNFGTVGDAVDGLLHKGLELL